MKRIITVVSFLFLLPTLLLAGTTGKIRGKVTDLQTGEPLIGANVIVVGTSFGAATDVKGEYVISNLEAGVYEVKSSYLGYKTVTVTNVRVNSDLSTELNFQLPATGVSVGEVTIVAKRPLINKSNTNAIRTTTNAEIDALPVRGVDNIVALTPGVTLQDGTIYVRGGRQDEVGYYLEGTNITSALSGNRQVTIPQDALEEIQVQAGGYTAEFGGANAGIIRTQLKSGGPTLKASLQYITDNLSLKGKSNRYNGKQVLGTYSYGYNDLTASLSGPLVGEKIKFFGLFDNLSQADANPQPFDGINLGTIGDGVTPGDTLNFNVPGGPVPGHYTNQYSGTATFTFDYNPLIVRLIGTYSYSKSVDGSIGTMFDSQRWPITEGRNGDFGFKVTHLLSKNTYYEINAGYVFNSGTTYDPLLGTSYAGYGDSVANAQAGAVWNRRPREQSSDYFGRYLAPLPYQIFTFQFTAPNAPIANYSKFKNENINLDASFTSNLSSEHSLKFGGQLQLMTFRNFSSGFATTASYAPLLASNPGKTLQDIEISQGIDNYGYDLNGNVYSGSDNFSTGQFAPKKPVYAGVYVEDRMEYKNLIVNAGLRYDYINTDNEQMVDPYKPENSINNNTGAIIPAGWEKAPTFSSLSPRVGFSFPITDQTVFHAQYGKFVQQSSLNDLYMGYYELSFVVRGGFFFSTPVGQNVRPERTTQYEVGFTQQIGNFASFDVTGYYKDISNEVVFDVQNVDPGSPFQSYTTLTNGDYATTKGIELSFNMRRTDRLMVNGSVSFQDAKGTGANPFSDSGIFGNPINPAYVFTPHFINPLPFNHSLSGNINLDYRWGNNDGPDVLHNFGASLLLTFASGHPYTLGSGGANIETDTRTRSPIEPINSSVTPSTFQADLQLDKTVSLVDKLSLNIFVQVINLFNAQNIVNVFTRTGSATDDGFLSDPNLGLPLVEKYGTDYAKLYQALNINYGLGYPNGNLYGPPRQIRVGVRFEY